MLRNTGSGGMLYCGAGVGCCSGNNGALLMDGATTGTGAGLGSVTGALPLRVVLASKSAMAGGSGVDVFCAEVVVVVVVYVS